MEVITKIYMRGKSRDEFGNPYWAAAMICESGNVICIPMTWGSSYKEAVIIQIRVGISRKEKDWKISPDCEYHYQPAYRDSQLERPGLWRIGGICPKVEGTTVTIFNI